jgi:hypothetical protein
MELANMDTRDHNRGKSTIVTFLRWVCDSELLEGEGEGMFSPVGPWSIQIPTNT